MAGEALVIVIVSAKADAAEIDVLVLPAQAPVIGQHILQTAADKPAHVGVAAAAAEAEPTVVLKQNLAIKLAVPHRNTARDIGQPTAEGVAKFTAEGEEIVRFEGT